MNKFKFNKGTGQYEDVVALPIGAIRVTWAAPTPKTKACIKEKMVKVAKWSLEKQRRSRINWYELLPDDVAQRQIAYERRATVSAMHKYGFLLKDIGDLFGVTGSRVASMRNQHERFLKCGRAAPAEAYLLERAIGAGMNNREVGRLAITARDLANVKGRDWLYV